MKFGRLFQFPKLGLALIGVSGVKAINQFIIFSFVSAIGGLSQAGYLALAYAITGPVFVFASMGLRTLILTHTKNFNIYSVELIRVWSSLIALLSCGLLSLIIAPNALLIIFAISLTKIPESFGEIYASFMQKNKHIPKMSFPQIASTLTGSLAFLVVFALEQNLIYAALSSLLVSGIVQFFVARRICLIELQRQHSDSYQVTKEVLLHQGMPSGVSDGVLSFSVNIPTLALAYYFTPEIVAVFSFGLYIISGLELILNAVSQAWIPNAKVLLEKSKLNVISTLKQGSMWLPLIIVSGFLAYIALVESILIFQPENKQYIAIPIAPILLIAIIEPFMFASSTSINVLNHYKRGMAGSFLALFLVAISAFILIPEFELIGAYLCIAVFVSTRLITNLFLIRE